MAAKKRRKRRKSRTGKELAKILRKYKKGELNMQDVLDYKRSDTVSADTWMILDRPSTWQHTKHKYYPKG